MNQRRSIEKSDEEKKSEHSSDQSHCYSSIVFPKQKRMKLKKGNCCNLMISWFPTWGYESSRLIPKVWEVCCWRSFSDSDETEEESEEDDNDIDYDQVLVTRKFKVITWENNSSNILFILNELAFKRELSSAKVKQKIWD